MVQLQLLIHNYDQSINKVHSLQSKLIHVGNVKMKITIIKLLLYTTCKF
jgi:hypothetical protein